MQKFRIQNTALRPNIDEILAELYLLKGEIKDKVEDIKETIYPMEDAGYSEYDEDAIITQATQDILLAQYAASGIIKVKFIECGGHTVSRNFSYPDSFYLGQMKVCK